MHKQNKKVKKSNKENIISLEDKSLIDFKKSKSFSVATTLSEYKLKSHIGEIYDYKPLHNKINNLCINKIINKEPSLNKKNSKLLCECIFNKNKSLSIHELENRIKNKLHTPGSHCITMLDTFKNKSSKKLSKKPSKKSYKKTSKKSSKK